MNQIIELIVGSIAFGVVFLYGCVGETINEKVGNLNLGIPGIMCMGALGGVMGVALYFKIIPYELNEATGESNIVWILLILLALIVCMIMSAFGGLIYSFFVVTLQANQNVTGLVLTTFGAGIMRFVGAKFFITLEYQKLLAAAGKEFGKLFTGYAKLGSFGRLFFSYGILTYLAFALAIASGIVLRKTRVGLFLRACGESPATADAQGINVKKYKYLATMIGAAIAGIGGLYYVMDKSGGLTFTEANIEGFGWLAVALVIFSVWKPEIGILGSILFGFLTLLPTVVTGVSTVNLKLFNMLPYVVTVVVLIITSIFGSKSIQPPGSLGLNYYREDR